MADFKDIYATKADAYEQLIAREDARGELLACLRRNVTLEGKTVADIGAGTGRVARMVAPFAAKVMAFDNAPAMLDVARAKLREAGYTHVHCEVAPNHALPLSDGAVDLAVAGWSYGHATGWNPEGWRDEIGAAVREMLRVVRPGGTAVIVETLGTGTETPAPPNANLAAYYAMLENEFGFRRETIRTDYAFANHDEAVTLMRFFFGDDRANAVRGSAVPECTGVWLLTPSCAGSP